MTDKTGSGIIMPKNTDGKVVSNYGVYAGFDSTSYQKYVIKQIVFNELQKQVNEEIAENKNINSIRAWFQKYSDTTFVAFQVVEKNSAAYLYATDHAGFIHFIMDANNNKRFDDDPLYVFDTTNLEDKYFPTVHVDFEYYDGSKIRKINVPYEVNAYTSRLPKAVLVYGNGKRTILETDVQFFCKAYKEGVYKSKNRKFLFNVASEHMGLYKNEPFQVAVQTVENNKILDKNPFIYTSKQVLEFNNGLYKVTGLHQDTLYLELMERTVYNGAIVGTMAPSIDGTDIMADRAFSLKQKRGKYVILNFWGSWCHPCIKELPALQKLYQKYKKVSFLSVAADLPEDSLKLKDLIVKNSLTWDHLRISRSIKEKGLLWDYKISAYPTTFLIDPQGKIVLREEGANALSQIDHYLEQKNP